MELLAPIPWPRKNVFCVGRNYVDHVAEGARAMGTATKLPEVPQFFTKAPTAVNAPGAPVRLDNGLTKLLDYEVELAVIIGKAGKHFDEHEAAEYIAGYTIFNDITARDIQRREMRSGVFSFCKAIDTFCPLGPWIVTPDEVGDARDLHMQLRVNGELRQESHSGNMSVTIPEIIAHYSALGYSRGDVLSTGTVSGVAGFSENAAELYLRPGDKIECEIEKIGTLANPVISWQDGHGVPAPPRHRW